MDGQTDVGHINLIGGLVTRNSPKNMNPQNKLFVMYPYFCILKQAETNKKLKIYTSMFMCY